MNIYIYILYLFIVLWTCVKTFVPKLDISMTSQDVQMFFSACHDTGATRRGAVFKTVLP